MEIVNAALMWSAVVVLAITAQRRGEQSTLLAADAIALSLTFNIDAVYLAIDGWLGGWNLLDLISNLLLTCGIYLLSRAALRAAHGPRFSSRLLRTGLGVTIAGVVGTFFLIEQGPSSTTFMLDYGSQLAAALYSTIQFSYVGVVMIYTAATCLRYLPSMSFIGFRAGFATIAAGCVLAVVLVGLILMMNLLNLVGSPHLQTISVFYTPLYISAILLLCVGYCTAPLTRMIARARWNRAGRRAYRQLLSIHRGTAEDQFTAPPYSTAELHRLTVTVLDHFAANPDERPSPGTEKAIAAAEDILMRGHSCHEPQPTP